MGPAQSLVLCTFVVTLLPRACVWVRAGVWVWEAGTAVEYKFCVDGEWVLNPGAATVTAADGTVNNVFTAGQPATVTFAWRGPVSTSQTVSVAGTFNKWTPQPLTRAKTGVLQHTVQLEPGASVAC